MQSKFAKLLKLPVIASFLIFSMSAIETWSPTYSWHDQQRASQLFLLISAAVALPFLNQKAIDQRNLAKILLIFTCGAISAWCASYPAWAFLEWAHYMGLVLLSLMVGTLHQERAQLQILGVMAAVTTALAFQSFVYFATALANEPYILSADLLFNGFSNPRFYSQFQVMALPVTAALIEKSNQNGKKILSTCLLMALVSQWCVALSLGGRGFILSILFSHAALMLIKIETWRIIKIQAIAALLGLAFFLFFFELLPSWINMDSAFRSSFRASFSGRDHLWRLAWGMLNSHPWFGIGPMHFAANPNHIAAHPHQAWLQWAAEWGVPAATLITVLAVAGSLKGAIYIKTAPNNSTLDQALWAAIIGGLLLAQVDGVFVMPYTETWLAIIVGICMARWNSPKPLGATSRIVVAAAGVVTIAILAYTLITQVPALPKTEEAYLEKFGTHGKPRFWQQGWIPMHPLSPSGS